jgi:predicted nucleic acid-binding protein
MVICDSSSLIHLSAIGRLGLLKDFYGTLAIPQAVWQEVVQLIRARLEGKIESLQTELERLRTEGGFWIEERLYRAALRNVGEE